MAGEADSSFPTQEAVFGHSRFAFLTHNRLSAVPSNLPGPGTWRDTSSLLLSIAIPRDNPTIAGVAISSPVLAPCVIGGAVLAIRAMVDFAIFRLTFLLAAGDYPVQEETKQRWIELGTEAASCDDPQRMEELAEAITALIEQEKQRLHPYPEPAPPRL
jgi:hypothetical protein